MPKPTERALKRKPRALIFLGFKPGETLTAMPDLDFEWFDTAEGHDGYWTIMEGHFKQDLKDHPGETVYAMASIVDTSLPGPVIDKAGVWPSDSDEAKGLLDRIKKDPTLVVEPPKAAAPQNDAKALVKGGRAKSPAKESATKSEARKGSTTTSDAPKPRAVRKKTAVPTGEGAPSGAPTTRAAGLKAKLAEKKAAAAKAKDDEPSPEKDNSAS